ncbi:MAG TPA: hypothetical protein EYN70_02380 [Planctomycetaceae bacterium]|jgi:hypothetical protein|nr:hypothetical protein [Planctomycetaceae bacterium]
MVAVWKNFSAHQETITEGLISGKLFIRGWQALRTWCCRRSAKTASEVKSLPVEKEGPHDQAQS